MNTLATDAYSKMAGQTLTEAVNLCESLPHSGTGLSVGMIGALGELCAGAFIAPIRNGKISVPRECRDSESIGLLVIEPGAKYALDRSFLDPTPRQLESAVKVIEQDWGLVNNIAGSQVVKEGLFSARFASYFARRGVAWFDDRRPFLGTVATRGIRLHEDQYQWGNPPKGVTKLFGRPLMVLTAQPNQSRPTMDTFFHELEHVRQAIDTAASTVPDTIAAYPEQELRSNHVGGEIAQLMQSERRPLSSSAKPQIAVEAVRQRHAAYPDDFTVTDSMKRELRQKGLSGYVFSAENGRWWG